MYAWAVLGYVGDRLLSSPRRWWIQRSKGTAGPLQFDTSDVAEVARMRLRTTTNCLRDSQLRSFPLGLLLKPFPKKGNIFTYSGTWTSTQFPILMFDAPEGKLDLPADPVVRSSPWEGLFAGWLLACLTSQQHASGPQGRISTDNFTCCHTEIEAADQTFYLTQSQYTDIGTTSPSADPIMPGTWQGSHWSGKF